MKLVLLKILIFMSISTSLFAENCFTTIAQDKEYYEGLKGVLSDKLELVLIDPF